MYNSIISPITEGEVYVNGRQKIHPVTGEVLEDVVASRPIFRAVAAEEINPKERAKPDLVGAPSDGRARARARKQLFELAICNDFDLFITLTLDQKEVDRYDYSGVVKKTGVWLDNLARRHHYRYVLVPELHKDGALHFHGLCSDGGLYLAESGHKDSAGRPVLNICNWRLGFSTAVRLSGDYGNVCRYITKYVTKAQSDGPIAGRYFYHGGELRAPLVRYYQADNWRELPGKVVEVEEAGLTLVYR